LTGFLKRKRPVLTAVRVWAATSLPEINAWLTAEGDAALKLQRPLPDGALMIVARGDRTGDPPGAAVS
jgi:hypothetical protein